MLSNVSTEVIIEVWVQPAQRLSQRLLHLGAASSVHTLQEGCHADWLLMHTFCLTSSHSLPSLNLGPGTELRLLLRGDVTVEKADRGYEKPERREGSDFRDLPSQKQKKSIQTAGKKILAQNGFL